jgi:hypothetical protein
MIILKPSDRLEFGKHLGSLLSEVYKFQPTYIEWIMLNTENYIIDTEAFMLLPLPTPISIGAVTGTEANKEIYEKGDIFDIILNTDIFNLRAKLNELKQIFNSSPSSYPEIKFQFSDEALRKNEEKSKDLSLKLYF